MKKTIAALIILTGFAATARPAELVEALVARVGDRIVTRSQYEQRLHDALEDAAKSTPPEQLQAAQTKVRSELLNEMLSELLLKDRADRLGLAVSPAELKDALGRLKAQYNLKSDEEFENSLKQSGMSRTQMEARLRDTLLTQKVFSKELRSREEMSDRDLREKYERDKEHFRRPERARLREIVVIPASENDPASIGKASARAVQVAQRAKEGGDFAALAKEFSDAPTRESGGDLGEVGKGELISALDSAAFAASSGAIVGPIQTRSGFHILQVEQKLPSELPAFESVKDQLRKDASDETFQRDYKAYVEKLRKEAFVQIFEENVPKA